jgi:hypothetical protein
MFVRSFTTQTARLFPVMLLALGFGLVDAQAKSDYSGTWKTNLSKSDFGAMPAPDSRTDVITHQDPDLKIKVTQSSQMGDMNYDLAFTTDGKESTNSIGDMFKMTSTAKWDGDNLVIDSKGNFNGTDFTSKESWKLAEDGKTMTIDRHITSDAGEFDQKILMDKQ